MHHADPVQALISRSLTTHSTDFFLSQPQVGADFLSGNNDRLRGLNFECIGLHDRATTIVIDFLT